MRRIAATIVLFLWSGLAVAGWLPLAFSTNQLAAFFAATGNDNNQCSQASPCLTLARANSIHYLGGATINLNGGDTFGGGTSGLILTTANAPAGSITIQSYGVGQATISSGNSTECVKATNVAAMVVNSLICIGGSATVSTTAGISSVNSLPGNAKLAGPTITNCTVSGYGLNGIEVRGANVSSGFANYLISGNIVHDVAGVFAANNNDGASSGIASIADPAFGLAHAHSGATISNNTVFNILGNTTSSGWSGSPIFISETDGATVLSNVVHDFGSVGHGSVGIWSVDSNNVTMRFNEAYNETRTSGSNGGGFDFDGGTTNSLMEFNWAHDNVGFGIFVGNGLDVPALNYGNNTIRFNITQNNAGGELNFNFAENTTAPSFVYNNTFINQISGNGTTAFVNPSSTAAFAVTIANNIFAGGSGTLLNINHASSLSFTGNDYYTYGQPFNIEWEGTTYTSFAAWQIATGQEKIAGSNVGLTSNPQIYVPGGGFVTNGYAPSKMMAYNLQAGSPMIGAGLNLTSQFGINPGPLDYYGASVSAASLPVGAAAGDFASFSPSSTAATNFLARVSSFTKLDNVNYNSLLSSGVFSSFDVLYILAAPNSAASLLNLLAATFPLTGNAGVTFNARQGYTGNGTTGFLDTGWAPATNGVNYTLASGTHFGYALTGGIANPLLALYGASNVGDTTEAGMYIKVNDIAATVNDGTGVISHATQDTKGLFLVDRFAGVLSLKVDGIPITTATVAPVALPTLSEYILAFNFNGAVDFSTNQAAAIGFGPGGLVGARMSQQINSFMMAYGINVY